MLVLTRYEGDSFTISVPPTRVPETIEISCVSVRFGAIGERVTRIGVTAPRSFAVNRPGMKTGPDGTPLPKEVPDHLGKPVLLTGGERKLIALAIQEMHKRYAAAVARIPDKTERQIAEMRERQCIRVLKKLQGGARSRDITRILEQVMEVA